ncbi:MAG: aldolase catalytic domain-containing protein [Lachnospiraceae bacterium]|nr:aldolase catalytic domain-containing protein [Lachnospiraceae bacterium]
MRKVYLLDCTLRDGGYINNFTFGEDVIRGFCKKIVKTGVEICEVGFIKGDAYDPNTSLFPDVESFKNVITPKDSHMKYVGMLDMSNPIPLERLTPCDGTSIDGIRVIFKKNKIEEAYRYCERIQELGYFISVNFVGTDLYSDEEVIEGIQKFNKLHPFAVSIVDSFGVIKRKQFLRLCYIADNNLNKDTVLAYHAHNNLQQAFGNAESLVEMNLKRDLIIDACVFGMGRGAGNLNLELFAEYMNENYDTDYKIEPMLEIMDEYLSDIYKKRQWGYSLPFYLSASKNCHPNYAVYLEDKDALSVWDFDRVLASIPDEEKANYSKEKAEAYYKNYLFGEYDDADSTVELKRVFDGKEVLLIAPGRSIKEHAAEIDEFAKRPNVITVSTNFIPEKWNVDYIFSNNMKRFRKIKGYRGARVILTSNVTAEPEGGLKVSFSRFAGKKEDVSDNSGLMLLRILCEAGVKKVMIAGMDGYDEYYGMDYYDSGMEYSFKVDANKRNKQISEELNDIAKYLEITFVTPTNYSID